MMSEFINVQINKTNLDTYPVRTSILKSLTYALKGFKGELLDVGCGKMPYRGFIMENSQVENYTGLDIETALVYDAGMKPDVTWDGVTMPMDSARFDCALATEVLEHCPEPETVLKEIYRVLKPDGILFFTVPFLWNLHEVPHDEYRYTPFALQRHLKNSGFVIVELKPTGGWHASMAQMLGLWVRRSPMPKKKRNLLSSLLLPVIKYLLKLDKPNNVTFKDGQMITGLYGIVKKPNE